MTRVELKRRSLIKAKQKYCNKVNNAKLGHTRVAIYWPNYIFVGRLKSKRSVSICDKYWYIVNSYTEFYIGAQSYGILRVFWSAMRGVAMSRIDQIEHKNGFTLSVSTWRQNLDGRVTKRHQNDHAYPL